MVQGVRWQELTRDECFSLLGGQHLGRVVLVDDRGPIALPVNFVLDQHTVLFRTDEGTKLDVAVRRGRVAFQIDGVNEATRTGWSVLVRGEAKEVTDPDELVLVRRLPLYPWAPGAKGHYIRILPTSLTGRRIALPEAPSNWWG
jgi:nitroimidazol reductase NimA-like FMN-containing flavoprotein (pyridoxamine 5'-phosphate oxidase superfamily)